MRNNSRGFTLIELLVVVSIIGMLASVVLVALNGARDRGVVAAGLQFAATNYHANGAYAMLIMNFNNSLTDYSQNSYVSSFTGTASYNSDSPSNSGTSLNTNTAPSDLSSGVTTTISPSVMPGLATGLQDHTVSLWIKPTDFTSNQVLLYSNGCTSRCINVQINASNLTMGPNDGGSGSDLTLATSFLTLNKWQNVTYSYTYSPRTYKVYVNGKIMSPTISGSPQTFSTNAITSMSVGNFAPSLNFAFRGLIDDVAIYKQALTDAQVQEIYAEGAAQHDLALSQ